MAISDFRISGQSLIKGNCHNSRTSDDIDIKLGPVTKTDKRNKKKTSKKLKMTSCQKIVTLLPLFHFFPFTASSEQSGSRTNQKTNLYHKSNTIVLSKGTILVKKPGILQQQKKQADIKKIKRTLVLKGKFSETTYVCVLTCQI